MKKILTLAALIASVALTACGGGDAPATVTQVPIAAQGTPVPTYQEPSAVVPPSSTPPPSATSPSVTPPPVMAATDVTLSDVPVNVKRSTVNVGERNVNLAAFNVAFDKMSENSSVQELVFRNVKGGDIGELFTQLRIADDTGDICSQVSCYVWWRGDEARVVFTYGWRPRDSELKTYALQADVNPNAPSGATFSFELIGVQMRQWGTTSDVADVKGRAMEVTTIVALPMITSSQGRQIMGATPGMQYEILSVTATCRNRNGCLMKEAKIFIDGGENVQLVGSGTLTPLVGTWGYLLQTDHFIGFGTTVTWSFIATATGKNVFAQWLDAVFLVEGVEVSPVANQTTECIDVAAKGGGTCSFGGKD